MYGHHALRYAYTTGGGQRGPLLQGAGPLFFVYICREKLRICKHVSGNRVGFVWECMESRLRTFEMPAAHMHLFGRAQGL